MIPLRLLPSGLFDGDVAAHLALLRTLPRVGIEQTDPIREDRLPLILAAAFRLLRDRPPLTPVVTTGAAALTAASLAWRGPIIHLASAPVSRLEVSLVTRPRASKVLLVVSSETDAQRARRLAAGRPLRCTVIRPIVDAPRGMRTSVRDIAGLNDDNPTVLLPGTIRRGGGHRLGLWAAGILAARDPHARVLLRTDPQRVAEPFGRMTLPPGAVRTVPDDVDEASLATAAEVTIVVPDRAPQLSAVAASLQAGTPVVSTRAFWSREGLPLDAGVRLVDDPKPRLIARTALEASEQGRLAAWPGFDPELARRQWLAVLHEVCGPAVRH